MNVPGAPQFRWIFNWRDPITQLVITYTIKFSLNLSFFGRNNLSQLPQLLQLYWSWLQLGCQCSSWSKCQTDCHWSWCWWRLPWQHSHHPGWLSPQQQLQLEVSRTVRTVRAIFSSKKWLRDLWRSCQCQVSFPKQQPWNSWLQHPCCHGEDCCVY